MFVEIWDPQMLPLVRKHPLSHLATIYHAQQPAGNVRIDNPSLITPMGTRLDYPQGRLLLTTQYSFCPHNTCVRIYRPVQNVYGKNMGAMWIWVLVPDAKLYMCPRVAINI